MQDSPDNVDAWEQFDHIDVELAEIEALLRL